MPTRAEINARRGTVVFATLELGPVLLDAADFDEFFRGYALMAGLGLGILVLAAALSFT